MEIRHLKTFRTVAYLLNFNKAAKVLNYAQSTISAQIKSLEEDLDVLLFYRAGKKITLTEAGSKLIRYAQKIIDMEKETISVVTNIEKPGGLITIRAPQSIGTYMIPSIIKKYHSKNPKMCFNVESCAAFSLELELRSGIIDIAFLLADSVDTKDFKTECLRIEPLILAAGWNHRLSGKNTIKTEDLNGETIILPKHDCGYKMIFEKILTEKKIEYASKMEFNSVEAVKQCIMKGLGVSVIPEISVKDEIRNKKLVALPWEDELLETSVIMIWHSKKWVSPALADFMDYAREVIA